MWPHSPPRIHFTPETPGLRVDLRVQAFRHLVRREQAEVPAFGRVGAEGVVDARLVEHHQVAEQREVVRRAEVVGRGNDEQHLGALAVDRNLDRGSRQFLEFVGGEVQAVPEAVRLDAEVVANAIARGGWLDDPLDVAAHQVQQLAADHGDFCRVDPVRAEHGAAPALGALMEVVEPLLEDVFGRSRAPASGPNSRPAAVK